MNILITAQGIYPYAVGGIEMHTYYISKRLSESQHAVTLFTIFPKGTRKREIMDAERVNIVYLKLLPCPLASLSYILESLAFFLLIRRKIKIDIIHAHPAWIPMISACLISIAGRIPFIVTCHGGETRLLWKKKLIKFIQWFMLMKATFVTCVSHEIATILESKYNIPRVKLFVVPNGYDKEVTERLKRQTRKNMDSELKILFVGSLRPLKAPLTLLQALQILSKKNKETKDVRLLIAGDGPLRPALENFCKENQMHKVHFLGKILHEKILEIMSESDIFVLTSIEEGMPTALIEAMALGKPVIATAVGGIPEVVKDGINGILVPPKSPAHVAEALDQLLTDSELRRKLGKAAAESVKDYTWSKIAEKYEKIYYEVLQQRSQRC